MWLASCAASTRNNEPATHAPADRMRVRSAGGNSMLAAAVIAVEMYVAAAEALDPVILVPVIESDIVANYYRFPNHRRRSPISRDPAAIGIVAVHPRVARSGACGARNLNRRGDAESDSDADVWGGEEAASQQHHHCDRLFH